MQRRRRSVAVHEHTDEGDVFSQRGAGGDQLLGDVHRPGEQRRVEQHHDGVDVRVGPEDACDVSVLRGGGTGDHVDGVRHACLGREQ